MGHPIALSLTVAAGSANGIALSQSLGGAGAVTLNGALMSGGNVTLTPARRIIVVSAADDSDITFTVTAPDRFGNTQTETFAGSNGGTASSTQDFGSGALSITASGATSGAITVGTSDTASTQWVPWSLYAVDFQVSFYGDVTAGSPTWQVDVTFDDVFGLWLPASVPFPRAFTPTSMSGFTADAIGVINDSVGPVKASRLTLTAAGTVMLEQLQQGY